VVVYNSSLLLSYNNSDQEKAVVDESLEEMYNSMIPSFAQEYAGIFDMDVFSLESFIWADSILNNYSIDSPLAIVPL
jgi:hypothetical protein